MFRYITGFLLLLLIASCRPEVFTPKPPGYFKIDTPATHEYQLFDREGFPYIFEYPVYANITKDTVSHEQESESPFWININIPGLNAVINLTYKQITEKQPLYKLFNDAYGFSFIHHEKTDGITPSYFVNAYGTSGVLYLAEGNTASRFQFAATDSVRHFVHGALYFDVTPNADSLRPANDFIEKDIKHFLSTLRWRTPK